MSKMTNSGLKGLSLHLRRADIQKLEWLQNSGKKMVNIMGKKQASEILLSVNTGIVGKLICHVYISGSNTEIFSTS